MMIRTIRFARTSIGTHRAPFIIAEMSCNHNGSLARALQIVDAASAAGVDALKIQTYTADTMTLDLKRGDFLIREKKSLWKGQSLYELYDKAHTPWKWHKAILDRCRQRGIVGFSTPFDPSAVDFLESLKVPLYKIASFENVDLRLVRRVAATGKPLIISTGLASLEELSETVQAARAAGCKDLVLLKCTSAYPARASSANLRTMEDLRKRFRCHIGLSDHTLGTSVSSAAAALGAVCIEKHFTLSRGDGGFDAPFSMEPAEMKQLVRVTRDAWDALGRVHYGPTADEKLSLRYRRSIYVSKDLREGESFTSQNLSVIRPGYGLLPKHLEALYGKRARTRLKRGTPMSWDLVLKQ